MSRLARRRVVLRQAVAGLALAIAAPAAAQNAEGPSAALIRKVSAEVIDLIQRTTGAEREAGIRRVLEANFDLAHMGRAALATHWEKATAEQRARFLAAVASAEARAYSERFGQYGGQTLTLGRVSTRPNNVSIVDSRLNQTSGPPIKIEWEVRDSGQGPRITDVKIEGVSMVMTRRSDFNSYIQQNGGKVQPLIDELEARAKR